MLKKKWSKRDPKLLERYKETMGDYLAKGHAMRITVEGLPSCDDATIWFCHTRSYILRNQKRFGSCLIVQKVSECIIK